MDKLQDGDLTAALATVPGWSAVGGEIQRTFQFRNFAESMRFVNRIADAAEASDHHPDILIRYNKVTLTLSTHDAGGLTLKDFDLARRADAEAVPA